MFFQTLGDAVFLAVSQTIFDSKLIDGLTKALPGESQGIIAGVLRFRAIDLASAVSPEHLSGGVCKGCYGAFSSVGCERWWCIFSEFRDRVSFW